MSNLVEKHLKHVPCICGSELIEISALNGYKNPEEAYCNSCSTYVADLVENGTQRMYHCENESNKYHLNGYDLCHCCAEFEIQLKNMYPNQYGPAKGVPIQYTGMGIIPDSNAINMPIYPTPNSIQFNPMMGQNAMHMNMTNYNTITTEKETKIDLDKSLITTENQKQLTEMLQSSKKESGGVDSKYVFHSSVINSQVKYDRNECKLETCKSLKRMSGVLQRYHSYINIKSHKENIYEHNDYDNKNLLNDFNHLLICHSSDHEFENIYDFFIKTSNNNAICSLTKCTMIRRNRRHRSRHNTDLYFDDIKDEKNVAIITQQLLDKIHSYYFHSFDIGYKLTRKERENIMNIETKMDDYKYDNDGTFDRNVTRIKELITQKRNHNKYESDIELNRDEILNNKYTNNATEIDYSYGIRYFYWKWYQNNMDIKDYAHAFADDQTPPNGYDNVLKDWYIPPKYQSFKEELLNNKIAIISSTKWQLLVIKAINYLNTDLVREFQCPRTISAECYEMKYGQKISMDHIIALMIYANFDVIQSKFTETFRRIHKHETNSELKERHRNFYFLGRLLRECVECFGMKNIWRVKNPNYKLKVYHGINQHFTFKSLNAWIKGPLSTSTEYAVAANFCCNKGLILKLSLKVNEWILKANEGEEAENRLNCFDMQWISDYTNEHEVFLIGGLNKVEFDTIIDATLGSNYEKYIGGLKQMTYHMSSGNIDNDTIEAPVTREEQMIAFRLLSHQIFKYEPNMENVYEFMSCPDYMKAIVNKHCDSIVDIRFDSKEQQKELGNVHECKLHDLLFKYDNGWIKLNLIMNVFPNTERIGYTCRYDKDVSFVKESFIYDSVLQFAENNKNTKLSIISIFIEPPLYQEINPMFYQEMFAYIQSYKPKFERQCWNIDISCNNVGINIVIMITITNMNKSNK